MAKGDGKTLEKLYIELGLDLSQLQSDILAADKTVTENLGRLNRERNLIKIRMQADISGLDSVKDATQILTIQEKSLNEQLTISKDRLAILEAAYRQVAANQNSTALAVQNAEKQWQKERAEVGKLEAALKSLASQKVSIDTAHVQDSIAKLTARIKNIRIQAEIDTSKLQNAGSIFDAQKAHISAVTRELELQRQKYAQLQAQIMDAAKNFGGDSSVTLNFKTNALQQYQEIQRLEQKLKELQGTDINLKIRADAIHQAEQTINDRIARINATIDLVRVKTEVDTSKLSGATSEFDKAKVHIAALNRELELQTQKLRELQKAFATSVSANGLNHVKTINLGTDIQRQIREIDQLKAKLDELSKVKPPNGLLNGYLNIKGDIAGKLNNITSAFNGISSASHSADGAISKSLEIIGAIPHPAGKAVAALASIPLVIKGIESSLLSLAERVVASGDAFYVMSRGMQLSIADAAKLSTIAKVTGIEINEVNTAMRRFSMQLTKGGEKSSLMAQTLKRYGAELTDETGRMKNELELAQELGKAFRAAQEEGNGAAFRDIVGGKFWSGDFVTFLEDLADNTEAAKQVVKNGLANPAFAHQIQGEINTLNAQLGQLGGVFESALLPVVHEIVPRMTERFGELTKVIQANKENIRFFGDALALPVRVVNELTDGFISLSNAIDAAKDKGTIFGQIFSDIGNYRDDVAALMNVAPTTALEAIFTPFPGTTEVAVAAYREEIDEYKRAQEEAAKAAEAKKDEAAARHANTLALNKANLEAQQKLETALATTDERKIKLAQEAEDIIYGIRHSSYEKQLRDLERWEEEQLKSVQENQELAKNVLGQENLFDDEENAVYELGNAKRLQIEEENAKTIKQLEAEVATNVDSIWQTELENRLAQIDREKQAWIQKGVDEVKATQWAEQAKADAQRQAAMNVLRNQGKEYAAYQQGGLEGLEAYKLKQLRKSGVRSEFLDMTPEQLQDFQRASDIADKSLLPNFMTDKDRDHYQRFKNGLPLDEPAVDSLTKSVSELPTAVQGATDSLSEMTTAVQSVTETLNELPTATYSTTENPAETPTDDISAENTLYDTLSRLNPEIENATLQLSAMTEEIQLATDSLSKITPPQSENTTASPPQSASDENAVRSPFAKLEPEITNVVKQLSSMNIGVQGATKNFLGISTRVQGTTAIFSSMSTGLHNVTVKVDALAAALQELTNRAKEKTVEKDPVEVTTNVQIDEATAWDSDHIQQLADKVADRIQDAVVSAIGGDSNSY